MNSDVSDELGVLQRLVLTLVLGTYMVLGAVKMSPLSQKEITMDYFDSNHVQNPIRLKEPPILQSLFKPYKTD